MNPAIITALVEAYVETVKLWTTMLEGMSPEDRADFLSVIAERETWWQEHVWGPLGDALTSLDTD